MTADSPSAWTAREQLPQWAEAALRSRDDALARRDGGVSLRLGGLWRLQDGRLSVWSKLGTRKTPVSCIVSLVWPIGLGLLIWATVGLRYDEVILWRWLAAAFLLAAGTIAFVYSKAQVLFPSEDAVLAAPDGLIQVNGGRYRVVPRDLIAEVGVRDGELVAVPRFGEPLSINAATSDRGREILDDHAKLLSAWFRDGAIPARPDMFGSFVGGSSPFFNAAFLCGVVAAVGGLTYLTVVMPARSDAGTTVTGFISDVKDGRHDVAYQRLAKSYRTAVDLEAFEQALPEHFRRATGFTVNGISRVSNFDGSELMCIDGWLDGVPDNSRHAFGLVPDGDELKIHGWQAGACEHSTWWTRDPR